MPATTRSAKAWSDRSETKSILFTDLVNSTALLQRVGDEDAVEVFKAHHRVLSEAATGAGGDEVKWLGDGLMVAFASAADAVRCAVAMQQASARHIDGEILQIRVGVTAGEATRSDTDYFGTHVVVARRLCDRAQAGQILCTVLVANLLSGRHAFNFRPVGDLDLKGIEQPVATCEVVYEHAEQIVLLSPPPFTGRTSEMAKLQRCFADARAGRGAVVMLVGESGIGKTRTAEEFLATAHESGAEVLRASCHEGESGPPFGPFVEAMKQHAPFDTSTSVGVAPTPSQPSSSALADSSLGPASSEGGRFELFERVAQALIATSVRAPVVLMIDDLQWADNDTILMLCHVAGAVMAHRVLVLGAYRESDLDLRHPLAGGLVRLRRETRYERILMKGLDATEVGELLQRCTNFGLPYLLVTKIADETGGNPFFVREVLLHLVEEGKLHNHEGHWVISVPIDEIGIPEGVRQVVTLRLSRLSTSANQLLSTASAFQGPFPLEVAATVAELGEPEALNALDDTLAAGFLRRSRDADRYEFSHTLVGHTLYAELSPSRQVRLHRRIAETMEHTYGGAMHFAGELAYQFHRSAAIPGGEAAFPYALAAADSAARLCAWEELAAFLKIALDVLEMSDPRRRDVLSRLGLMLPWTLAWQDTFLVAQQVGEIIARSDGDDAAMEYLADVVWSMVKAGATFDPATWALTAHALRYAGERRGFAWARLACVDQRRRDSEEADNIGIPLENVDSAELQRVISTLLPREQDELARHQFILPTSRHDVLDRFHWNATYMTFWAGEYQRSLPLWSESAVDADREVNLWVKPAALANAARCQLALGDFAAAKQTLKAAEAIGVRPTGGYGLTILSVRDDMRVATDERWEEASTEVEPLLEHAYPDQYWALAALRAGVARAYARTGRRDDALKLVPRVCDALNRAGASAQNYPRIACNVAEVLWLLENTAEIESIELNIREKVLQPDFRYPMVDARLSMARLAALRHRFDDAASWFVEARAVLDAQGARPLRAIVDYDEALMYFRRRTDGDRERGLPLLEAALVQFREVGMTGWIRRAVGLRDSTQQADTMS